MFFRKDRSEGAVSWIIAGLGNPGTKYDSTRHNAGFHAADIIADRCSAKIDRLKHRALSGRADISGQGVLLLKPQTFMNLSGEAVADAARFYKVKSENIIVIYDDAALEPGKLRIRKKGSDGGHNGMKSIIFHLKSDEFPRVKIGVGAPPSPEYRLADWVLARLTQSEEKLLAETIDRAAGAAMDIIISGADNAMNKWNG